MKKTFWKSKDKQNPNWLGEFMRVLRSTSPQSIKAFFLSFCWGEACKVLTWPTAILTWICCPWKPWLLGHTDENATLHAQLAVPHACPQIRSEGSLFCAHYSGIGESGILNVAFDWVGRVSISFGFLSIFAGADSYGRVRRKFGLQPCLDKPARKSIVNATPHVRKSHTCGASRYFSPIYLNFNFFFKCRAYYYTWKNGHINTTIGPLIYSISCGFLHLY